MAVNFVDEVLKHLFGVRELGDDAILHGPYGCDVLGRPAQHFLRLRAHSDDDLAAFLTRFVLHGDDRGFVEYDST